MWNLKIHVSTNVLKHSELVKLEHMLKISELSGYQNVSVLHVKVFQHVHKNVYWMHLHVHDVVHSTNSFTFRSE